jgi:hypothetical protein
MPRRSLSRRVADLEHAGKRQAGLLGLGHVRILPSRSLASKIKRIALSVSRRGQDQVKNPWVSLLPAKAGIYPLGLIVSRLISATAAPEWTQIILW